MQQFSSQYHAQPVASGVGRKRIIVFATCKKGNKVLKSNGGKYSSMFGDVILRQAKYHIQLRYTISIPSLIQLYLYGRYIRTSVTG